MTAETHQHSSPGHAGASDLAALLAPGLIAATGNRLSDVQWFRSSWQSGGAATGYATFNLDDGPPQQVVVKLPVGPAEYRWTTGLGGWSPDTPISSHYACAFGPTPRVYAAGTEVGGYDLAWLVVERLQGQPVSANLNRASVETLLRAAADWYARAGRLRDIGSGGSAPPPTKDWGALLHKAREALRVATVAEPHRWKEAVHNAQKKLDTLVARWESRPINTWCHGDLHPGNAMLREGVGATSGAACVLIDLALVHPGNWIEDAVYLERLHWGRPQALGGVKCVTFLAKARRDLGLATDEDYTMLANVRRVLMAAAVPVFLAHEGHPRYVAAALETLERLFPLACR